MPTTVITGRDLVLTIATVNYDAQATTVSLEADHVIETYQTLDGRAYKAIDDSWTLNVEMLADWGATGSLCESLWTATESSPNTTLRLHSQLQLARYSLAISCQHSQMSAVQHRTHRPSQYPFR
jgi:hypothetical protein